MHVADNFSAKRWADNLISMAEGSNTAVKVAEEKKVETIKFVAPVSNNSMAIDNHFSTKAWTNMMLAKARHLQSDPA